jgi:precorrin-6A/cobalt-precorrin-6A reductase
VVTESLDAVLILGGTGEARALAAALVDRGDRRVVSSLAGRVSAPLLPVGEVRLGGFGGPEGLRDWLTAEGVGAVVDATHPFAARISAAAVAATGNLNVPLVVLRRPGWQAGPGDDWQRVPDMTAAAEAVAGREGPVLLTTGRGGLEVFADLPHRFVIRTVDPPTGRLPDDHLLLLSRGPYEVAAERAVLDQHEVRLLVTKDSGGAMTEAKLIAARAASVSVVMVDRPPMPGAGTVSTVADVPEALAWLDRAVRPC